MFELFSSSGVCTRPCSTVSYSLTPRRTRGYGNLPPNRAAVGMYYNEIRVQYRRERVLYGLVDIIAAVGGSLGLFLGFSFLDFALWALGMIQEKNDLRENLKRAGCMG